MKKLWKKVNQKDLLLFSIFCIIYLVARLFDLERRTSFGADQEVLAFRALEIISGDIALIGMTVSVGGFSLGPLFVYLWSFFQFIFSGNPISGSYLSIFLGLSNILILYLLAQLLFKSRLLAAIWIIIYIFSYSIYIWDISPWTPSLYYCAQFLITVGAYWATKKPSGFIITALGFALGFQAHIAVLLSAVPIAIFWLLNFRKIKQVKIKTLVIAASIITASLLPNLLFDLTHNFVNTQRLLGVLGESPPPEFNPVRTDKVIYTTYKSFGEMLIPSVGETFALVLFIITMISSLIIIKFKKDSFVFILLLSAIVPSALFLFWKGNFSEYYLTLPLIPVYLLLVGYLVYRLLKKLPVLIYLVLFIFIFINLIAWHKHTRPLNLAAMKTVVNKIKEKGGTEGYGVSLTTHPGYKFGYSYLFHYYKLTPDIPPKPGETKIFTIVVPAGYHGVKSIEEYDGIGLLWEGV